MARNAIIENVHFNFIGQKKSRVCRNFTFTSNVLQFKKKVIHMFLSTFQTLPIRKPYSFLFLQTKLRPNNFINFITLPVFERLNSFFSKQKYRFFKYHVGSN